MKIRRLAPLLLLAGCVTPSLHGIPAEQRVELPDELLGEWHDEDEGTTLTVARRSNGSCEVLGRFIEEDQEPRELCFAVSAIELADQLILDVTLAESEFEELAERYGSLVIPSHVFYRLRGDGQAVSLAFLDGDWLAGRPQLGRIDLFGEGHDLLTPGSAELLELLTAAAGDEAAWEGEWRLTRRP